MRVTQLKNYSSNTSVILIRLGYNLANLSKAASRPTGLSLCTWRRVSPVSLVLVIVDLNGVLLLFRLLKDLSAVQVVTGSVQRILLRRYKGHQIPGRQRGRVHLRSQAVLFAGVCQTEISAHTGDGRALGLILYVESTHSGYQLGRCSVVFVCHISLVQRAMPTSEDISVIVRNH